MNHIIEHLDALRAAMRRVNVDAVIIPGTDPHHSEYPAKHWKFRDYITGFTGSAGTAVITLDEAGLWTDSRYFLQAEQQLAGTGIDLYREGLPDTPDRLDFLASHLNEDDVIAIDGRLFSLNEVNRLDRFCGEHGFMLATDFAAADRVWPDRPSRPMNPVYIHDVEYAGEDIDSKMERTMQVVEEQLGAEAMLVTALDDIAWLFNLRGSDVAFSPVFIAFAYISRRERSLFIDGEKITPTVKQYLKEHNVHVRDYDDITRYLERKSEHEVVLLDPDRVSDALVAALPSQKVFGPSPVVALKALKNDTQIAGFRAAMERDGAALVRLFKWIEENADAGITEVDVWEQGKRYRAQSDLYRDDSFAMIAGYKEHGAIVHYQATAESASTLAPTGLLLVDSGAQYLDATTDITRTITLGDTTPEERRDYTLVLKGHLALARAHFPVGIAGAHLDALARMPLWENGLHFMHGTGHGVGHFLCCHEGPQSIRTDRNGTPLQPGMVTSNEPGLYRTGKYGIRIENLLLTVDDCTTEFAQFLKFETLTLFPYDLNLIDTTMLTAQEVEQINDYHATVRERLLPHLTPDEAAWLTSKTQPL